MARCLMEPSYLESLRAAPENPLDPRSLERLRLFGGFITKIQHNDLWEQFPATRRLLHDCGLELPFFADYRAEILSVGRPKLPPREKARDFAEFLAKWLVSRSKQSHARLLDVLRHERQLFELSFEVGRNSDTPLVTQYGSLDWKSFLRLIPVFPYPFRMAAFDRDPTVLAVAPTESRTRRAGPVVLGYSKMPDGSRRVLTLDRIGAAILAAVNGRRQVRAAIARARACGLGAALPRQFRDFFEQAAQAEIIGFWAPEQGQ
ncbi:MAG TPA: hypothetical protein VH639_10050 [Bryobacteraceae bacterium]